MCITVKDSSDNQRARLSIKKKLALSYSQEIQWTNDIVTVDYEGSLPDGTVFDSSYKRGQPATFPLSGVIKGWQIALAQMPIGATWEIYIPSNLAYGESGTPDGSIGPNQALIFKVHLISAKPTPE